MEIKEKRREAVGNPEQPLVLRETLGHKEVGPGLQELADAI